MTVRLFNNTLNYRSCLALNEVEVRMQMVNGEVYGRNCGLNGSNIPVFIEK
jgi:hypothetical protein